MSDNVAGTDWSSAELDAIVADSFAMLRAEQARQPYNKTAHRKALMEDVHRSDGSIEFKHQNISAVLTQLGLPRSMATGRPGTSKVRLPMRSGAFSRSSRIQSPLY